MQYLVFECLLPTLDFARRLGMQLGDPDMIHTLILEPIGQVTGDVR